MDTFVRIVGILRDGFEYSTDPHTVDSCFQVRHDGSTQLYEIVDSRLRAILEQHGMFSSKKSGQPAKNLDELVFYPLHVFHRFELEAKPLVPEPKSVLGDGFDGLPIVQ